MSFNLYLKKIIGVFIFCFMSEYAIGQSLNVENIKTNKGLKLNGGLSFNTVYNAPSYMGVNPLSYFVSGTLNLNLFGINVPIVLSYSNRRFSYSQPYSFNQLSFHPTYKWATAHIGTNYMTFSKYSLSGHQFQGVGFDLTPGRWNVSLMAGQLVKAQTADTLIGATYKRMGYGAKASYRGESYHAGITIFGASDDVNSINSAIIQQNRIPNAQSNLVIGLQTGGTLFKALQWDVEYHNSILTANKTAISNDSTHIKSLAGLFYSSNATSKSYNAFKTQLSYNIAATKTLLGIGYERVDPNYRTLGGYYFVNDFENWTINFHQSLLESKINVGGNIGLQRNDIKNTSSSSQRRFIGSLNANANISDKWTIGADYSNFTSYSYIRTVFDDVKRLTPFDQLDTLRYTQISNNFSLNSNYTFRSTETKSNALVANIAFMTSADKQGDIVRIGRGSNFISSTLSYSASFLKSFLGYHAGINYNYNTIGADEVNTIGPVLGVQKGFLQNTLRTNFSTSFLHSKSLIADNNSINLRLNANYILKQQHSLTSNFGFSQANYENISRNYISLSFGYNYTF